MAGVLHLKCALVAKGAFDATILPGFQSRTGIAPTVDWAPTTVILQQIAAGEHADAVLVLDEAVDILVGQGRVDGATSRPILRSRIGVAVAKGAPHPDISTVAAFSHAMTTARSVCYSRAGASGVHFAPMIERIGIAEAVNARATIIPAGFTAERLVTGEADIAIQQLSELAAVPGIEIVGPLPDAVQKVTTFVAAVMTTVRDRPTALAFLAALASDESLAAYRAALLDPV